MRGVVRCNASSRVVGGYEQTRNAITLNSRLLARQQPQSPNRPFLIRDSDAIPHLDSGTVVLTRPSYVQAFVAITNDGIVDKAPFLIRDSGAIPHLDNGAVVRTRSSYVQTFAAIPNNGIVDKLPLLILDSDTIPYLDNGAVVLARSSYIQAFPTVAGYFCPETCARGKEGENTSERVQRDRIRPRHLRSPVCHIRVSSGTHIVCLACEVRCCNANGRFSAMLVRNVGKSFAPFHRERLQSPHRGRSTPAPSVGF